MSNDNIIEDISKRHGISAEELLNNYLVDLSKFQTAQETLEIINKKRLKDALIFNKIYKNILHGQNNYKDWSTTYFYSYEIFSEMCLYTAINKLFQLGYGTYIEKNYIGMYEVRVNCKPKSADEWNKLSMFQKWCQKRMKHYYYLLDRTKVF